MVTHPLSIPKKKKINQNHSEVEEGDFVRKKHMERF
jgi:hypothetical protein